MDQQPKRRVLSLSLSQPGKQSRRLKLKRHASAKSQNESKVPCEEWPGVDNSRDSVEINLSEDRTNLITSKTSDDLPIEPVFCDTNETSCILSSIQQEKKLVNLNQLKSEEGFEEKCVVVESAGDKVTTRRARKKSPSPKAVTRHTQYPEDKEDDDDFVKPSVIRKKSEKISPKNPSSNSHTVTSSDNERNEIGEIGSSSGTNIACTPSLATREDVSAEDKRSSLDQGRSSSCIASPKQDKPFESVSVPKDDEDVEVLQCPLCCRLFDKISSKTSHLKSCASKHKVTTQQLLEALELQRRQASERKALGLPAIASPCIERVKKAPAPKKESRNTTKMDTNLQLALAMSLSLQDAEKVQQEPSTSESSAGVSLDHFGFTSKPVLGAVQPRPLRAPAPKGKSKVKKTPALLTRTAEERQRIITEKVAMVLMEEVASGEEKASKEINIKSMFLQECLNEEKALWAKSHTSPSKNDRTSFYVQNLRSFISPSKVEMGSKVMHLSQIVGHFNTPSKGKGPSKEVDLEPNSPTEEEVSSDTSFNDPDEPVDPAHIEMELRAKLFNDWASMVNNASMSDLAIYPQEGRDIPAHKMVLHVRCPRILSDICRQRNPLTGNEVEVIMWSKTPHAAALAFLEYIYCGSVKSIRVLSEDLTSISWLADHYKVSDLKKYLKSVSVVAPVCQTPSQAALKEVKDFNEDCQKLAVEPKKDEAVPVLNENVSCRRLSKVSADLFASPVGTPTRSDSESIYSEATVQGVDNRSSCSSPDMFCDDETSNVGKRFSMENAADSENVIPAQHSVAKTLFSTGESHNRPPSQSNSVSSERTVLLERTPPSVSPCPSASSDKTVIIVNNSPPPSPAISTTSAATELLDFNQSITSRPGSSLNDSKRKHSDSSLDDDSSLCKRQCPAGSTPGPEAEKKESDVEFCDLTQDSDSSTSFPVIPNNFSGNSCDNICISSETEISDSDANLKSPEQVKGIRNQDSNHSNGNNSDFNEAEKDCEKAEPGENPAAYVSPVWEGFEDLNYDDPFFSEPVNLESPPKTTASSPKAHEDAFSTKIDEERNKVPLKSRTSSEEKCSDVEVGTKSSSDCEMTDSSPTCTVISEQLKPSSPGLEALLDDSLDINDSILRQAEKGVPGMLSQRATKGTPVNRILSSEPDGVTPLANYSAMKTPELKKELQKYGLKPTLGKRKGKLMLRHIYNELHPWVPIETNQSLPERMSLSQPSCSSSLENKITAMNEPNSRRLSFSDADTVEKNTLDKDLRNSETDSDSDSDYSNRSVNASLQEIKYLEGEDDNNDDDCEPKSQATSKRVSKADLPRIVSNFIRNDRELHQKVLEYEPIWIEKLQADLLSNGFKCGIEALMTFLDEKCITFRSESSGSRVRKKKPKSAPVKKTARNLDTNDIDSD